MWLELCLIVNYVSLLDFVKTRVKILAHWVTARCQYTLLVFITNLLNSLVQEIISCYHLVALSIIADDNKYTG